MAAYGAAFMPGALAARWTAVAGPLLLAVWPAGHDFAVPGLGLAGAIGGVRAGGFRRGHFDEALVSPQQDQRGWLA
jgi:hypothetical protein